MPRRKTQLSVKFHKQKVLLENTNWKVPSYFISPPQAENKPKIQSIKKPHTNNKSLKPKHNSLTPLPQNDVEETNEKTSPNSGG